MRAILNCVNNTGKTYGDGLIYNESKLNYTSASYPYSLNDADGGGSTGWTFEVTGAFSSRTSVAGVQTFYDPNVHTEGWAFSSGTPQISYAGLDNSKSYTLTVTADHGVVDGDRICDVTVGGVTKQVNAYSGAPLADHQAIFTGVSPTANEILVDFSNPTSYIVAFEIAEDTADVTAPVLSLPTGTSTGQSTGSGTVTTDEGNGTLYHYASTNASETAATIKASGDSQAVSASGVQNVTFTGLTASTTYYAHYLQDDAATNESNVVSSASFTTDAPSYEITTPPVSIEAATQTSVVISNPAVTPTTGNTEVKFDNDLGPAATVDSVTGSGPYTINFTFPRTTAKKFNSTGYPLYVEVDADNATSSAVPYCLKPDKPM